jgi:putative ABC transport system substrate-binding protein
MRALVAVGFALWSFGSFAAGTPPNTKPRVAVIKSGNSPAYQHATAGFMAQVSAITDELVLPEGGADEADLMKKLSATKPALVFALGAQAAVAARRNLTNTPIIFALVPRYESYDLVAPNVTGISYVSSLQTGMETLKALDPKSTRLGILYDPGHSKGTVSDIEDAVTALGFKVVRLEVDDATKVERALKAARRKVDAMFLLSDPTVGSETSVQSLVAFSRTERVPLVGLTQTHVQQGALFALSPSPVGLGEQAGRIANRVLHEKVNPGAMAIAQPEGQELAINLKTLQRLALVCDTGLNAFKVAGAKGYAIKVFP